VFGVDAADVPQLRKDRKNLKTDKRCEATNAWLAVLAVCAGCPCAERVWETVSGTSGGG